MAPVFVSSSPSPSRLHPFDTRLSVPHPLSFSLALHCHPCSILISRSITRLCLVLSLILRLHLPSLGIQSSSHCYLFRGREIDDQQLSDPPIARRRSRNFARRLCVLQSPPHLALTPQRSITIPDCFLCFLTSSPLSDTLFSHSISLPALVVYPLSLVCAVAANLSDSDSECPFQLNNIPLCSLGQYSQSPLDCRSCCMYLSRLHLLLSLDLLMLACICWAGIAVDQGPSITLRMLQLAMSPHGL